jgi:hypothetical protein
MLEGSLYHLDSNQLSKIIYRERRRLDIVRFKRLLKRRQEERAKELESLQDRLKSAAGLSPSPELDAKQDNDYFMTQVEQEEEEDPDQSQNPDEPSEISPSQNPENEKNPESAPKPNYYRPASNRRPQFFQSKSGSDSHKDSAQSSAIIQRNYTNRLGPKALLQIDSRWNCVPKYGEPLNEREHLKRVYTFDGALKGKRRPFVPSLRTKRHPQLEKIEAYFKDCNPEYIPRTPLMKIPTVFEIERNEGSRATGSQG